MVLRGRIELPTSSLPMMCSTTELPQLAVECGGLCHNKAVMRKHACISVNICALPDLQCETERLDLKWKRRLEGK